jgi:hypothetical protein
MLSPPSARLRTFSICEYQRKARFSIQNASRRLVPPGFLFLSSGLLRRIQMARAIVTSERLDPRPESVN